ncbi:hypothetical protein SAMD00019534_012720 [Acytostelium subglobosum LB1]|uniref:hypothetical protein n=1 Tax=Acytostelium subglobosum LB1 TaxID=1410327 RepID=UPI000644EAA8|nr:hypothetical protein SAMD00019534_012720 [Acytostelium subglobosum LB1]GAM18097.1 hypothetical protein SAMD00019534_012720 [Acytostelium subglobosum LB1]|eukprot:XP_012758693.1 hypothetical protein SAMD00019534_012720 [Acytostelium subglobosum LB1]
MVNSIKAVIKGQFNKALTTKVFVNMTVDTPVECTINGVVNETDIQCTVTQSDVATGVYPIQVSNTNSSVSNTLAQFTRLYPIITKVEDNEEGVTVINGTFGDQTTHSVSVCDKTCNVLNITSSFIRCNISEFVPNGTCTVRLNIDGYNTVATYNHTNPPPPTTSTSTSTTSTSTSTTSTSTSTSTSTTSTTSTTSSTTEEATTSTTSTTSGTTSTTDISTTSTTSSTTTPTTTQSATTDVSTSENSSIDQINNGVEHTDSSLYKPFIIWPLVGCGVFIICAVLVIVALRRYKKIQRQKFFFK